MNDLAGCVTELQARMEKLLRPYKLQSRDSEEQPDHLDKLLERQQKQMERQDKMLEHSKQRLAATLKLEKEYTLLVDSIIRHLNKPDKHSDTKS